MDATTVQVWQVLGTVLGTLIILLLVTWAGKQTLRRVLEFRRAWRGQLDGWRGAVDEPEDALIAWLAQKTGLSPEVCSAFLSAFLQALADGLDSVQMPASPEKIPAVSEPGSKP